MALINRKYEVQTSKLDEIKMSFEGETPAYSAPFHMKYEDILRAMEVIDKNKPKKRMITGFIILIVCGLIAIPNVYAISKVVGWLFIIMFLSIIFNQTVIPVLMRRSNAKKVAKEAKTGTVNFFPGGYQLIVGEEHYSVPFRVVTCYETKDIYVFILGTRNFMVFNRAEFGENDAVVREILIANIGYGRRYFVCDDKGKAINVPKDSKK